MRTTFALSILALAGLLTVVLASPELPDTEDPYAGRIAKASDDWKRSFNRMQPPKEVSASLWAAEPDVANIVSFTFDEQGKCYVAEVFRLHRGVTDNRGHADWRDEDLASRTVEDRVAMYRKYLGNKFGDYEKEEDRVRLVEDTKGAGKADRATVFAGGFKTADAGLGSGVLAREGKVWYTCIPSLWLLEDIRGVGRADVKKALSTGYGVHVSYIGHDLHGLTFGPDGRIYFTVGDRGMNVPLPDGKSLAAPDTGSVLRCDPDGSNLEIFATGLRNPQELAFDDQGNLFTADNNADGGDAARWVHLVEGGDSGWRIGYQYLPSLGPWNAEKLWHKRETNTASYLLPPAAHVGNGPSGLAYHPGVSLLPEETKGCFFLCDFRGSGGGSGIHRIRLKVCGASFDIDERQTYVQSVLATDCEFGPDGGFYLSDWIDGWGLPNKGRIYKLFDKTRLDSREVAEVKTLLAAPLRTYPPRELARLLGHADRRVRLKAQFALAEHKDLSTLTKVLEEGEGLARIHAIWGLGQIGRQNAAAYKPLLAQARAENAEVRVQALRVLGEGQEAQAADAIKAGLKDTEPRVRLYAGLAAARLRNPALLPDVIAMLADNADRDPYLRHAGVMALAATEPRATLNIHASPAVRLADLLALRRKGSAAVAAYLHDGDPKLVLEAARAIYDEPIPAALPALAKLATDLPPASFVLGQDFVLLRALAANHRLGQATPLARFAARPTSPEALRVEALKMLGDWERPSGRDRIVGLWRPSPERKSEDLVEALVPWLGWILASPDKVRAEGARLAAKHGIKDVGPVLLQMVKDGSRPASLRVDMLRALESLKDSRVDEAAEAALKSDDGRLRHQGRRISLKSFSPKFVVQELTPVLDKATTPEKQGALEMLGDLQADVATSLLARQLDALEQKAALPEIQLDILQAAERHASLKARVAAYRAKLPEAQAYHDALHGGDAEEGRKLFFEKTELACLRCHKMNGLGGEVGPDLTGIAKRAKRDYLLDAIVHPNKDIAKGFDSVVLTLTSGKLVTGVLRSEDALEVRLVTAEGQTLVVPKSEIDDRQRGPSAMPGDLMQKMTRRDLRDLVEFLATP